MKTLRVVTLSVAVAVVAAACGGEDEEATEGSRTPAATAASTGEFCEAVVAAEEAVFRAATGGDPAPVEPLVDTVEDTAPAELEEEVDVVVTAVRRTLEERDDAPLRDPVFGENEERVDVWVAENCDFQNVYVTAVDYAFDGVPRTIPAGITTFHFRNEGKEMHEMLTVRLKDEETAVRDLTKLSDEEAEEKIDYLGSAFGPPGEGDVDSRGLEPGRYALVCLVPVGSTSPAAAQKADGPSHLAKGMWAELIVE